MFVNRVTLANGSEQNAWFVTSELYVFWSCHQVKTIGISKSNCAEEMEDDGVIRLPIALKQSCDMISHDAKLDAITVDFDRFSMENKHTEIWWILLCNFTWGNRISSELTLREGFILLEVVTARFCYEFDTLVIRQFLQAQMVFTASLPDQSLSTISTPELRISPTPRLQPST